MSNSNNNSNPVTVKVQSDGITLTGAAGSIFAAYLSWTLGNPIGWNVVHFVFGWLYVLYLCAGFGGGMPEGIFQV